eukprot:g5492.t1
MIFDVLIAGAGPAGLSVLSALRTPEGILSNESQWKLKKNAKQYNREKRADLSVCVVDPSKNWLHNWKGRFQSLKIDRLRSPAWANPDFLGRGALVEYAWKHNRENELHVFELPRKASDMRQIADAGLFQIPGSALFEDFCDDLIDTLPHHHVMGTVVNVEKGDDGAYIVTIKGCAEPVVARSVVFALGAAGAPRIPLPLCDIEDKSRIIHTYSWQKLLETSFLDKVVVVIGGGLSAAQAALLAVRQGSKRTVQVSRRPLQSRHYDLPIEWMEPRTGWRVKQKEKSGNFFRMFEYYDCPKEKRRDFAKLARGGGATVPKKYIEDLEHAEADGCLERRVDEIANASYENEEQQDPVNESANASNENAQQQGPPIRVTFRHGSDDIIADYIILATGAHLSVTKNPLLNRVANTFNLPLIDSLPDLDKDLQWGEEKFTVVGAFALLEIGPDAQNLTGCRRCAERCADRLGAFQLYTQVGGHRTNQYDVLFENDSDSDSEYDSE